jgi:hypothetical protein
MTRHTATPVPHRPLLTLPGANPKTAKNVKVGWLTAIMHFAPAKVSGREMCAHRTPGCTAACLNTAGRGAFPTTQQARINRAQFFTQDRAGFMGQLAREISNHRAASFRTPHLPAVRLNGTSDIPWERIPALGKPSIMELFPDIQFYDYTKYPYDNRADSDLPKNYQLTFSRAETPESDDEALYSLMQGRNVAVVFGGTVPATWQDWPVINGDEHDARIDERSSDGGPVIVALKTKGRANRDTTGFVVQEISQPFTQKALQ